MKTITTLNWVLVGLYGLLLIFTLFNINRPGNDAAGRGMEGGFLVVGVILLAAMAGLNLMPYNWSKITALVVQGLPLLVILYNLISNYLDSSQQQ
ncbi:hypothetical protein BN8_00252 [Fibrisoma limi BUZ 3]|uniref:Uncharacterized protein n=1 Tax=Fibrisoma limi BUZ 3 TaxID=1185876 RepID=I2GBR0_9BACT|nr:hypothetical protein [Fibrisoma limi]CCH51334.1 hypothetical protein BN8_00252 [Fibrisoma limi BUZ 3]